MSEVTGVTCVEPGMTRVGDGATQPPSRPGPSTTTTTTAATPSPPPTNEPADATAATTTTATFTSFPTSTAQALRVLVQDPARHGEGSGSYVSYQLVTTTLLDTYAASSMRVRRRFQDFVWLHRHFLEDCPPCILPPLPGKHRMEYLTGDRFAPEFLERRRVALQHYMDRVTRHPVLQGSGALKSFLEEEHLIFRESAPTKTKSVLFDHVSDAFISTFSRPKTLNEATLRSREVIQKLEDQLTTIERLHARMLKGREEERKGATELAELLKTLATMETLVPVLEECGGRMAELSVVFQRKMEEEEAEYYSHLRDYIAYCASARDALKQNELKQAEYEELSIYLEDYRAEKLKVSDPRRHASGIAGFLRDKVNSLQGIHPETARRQRLGKIEARISELEAAVAESQVVAERFAVETQKEMSLFLAFKDLDLDAYLTKYNDLQRRHHATCAEFWDGIVTLFWEMRVPDAVAGAQPVIAEGDAAAGMVGPVPSAPSG